MNNKKTRESAVRISLIDVMYGVTLAYGFTFIDKAVDYSDYFRFFFAYMVFIVDWIYVHRLYWGWEYSNKFLLLDIGVLFTISRLLFTSTAKTPQYFLWLSVLFGFYIAWDIVSKYDKQNSQYDWYYSIAGDITASVLFAVLWLLSFKGMLIATDLFAIAGPMIIYTCVVLSWFKKVSRKKKC